MVKKSNKRRVHPPNRVLYTLARCALQPFFKLRYGLRIRQSLPPTLQPPFVIVCNHASTLDFMISALSVYPHRVQVVTAHYYFCNRLLAPLLRLMGCIPKKQFLPDMQAIRSMMQVIGDHGVILLYPAGQVTHNGKQGRIPTGLGKLLKSLRAPVVSMRIDGAYLTRPKWCRRSTKGRIDVHTQVLLDVQQLAALEPHEVEEKVKAAIAFDDYAWQRRARVPFHGKHRMEGAQNVLYQCPRCKRSLCMRSRGMELTCSACGNTAVMDAYGFFHAKGPQDVVFEDAIAWSAFQSEQMRQAVQQPDFSLCEKVTLQMPPAPERQYRNCGEGLLRLDAQAVYYEGTADGQTVHWTFPLAGFVALPFTPGKNLEIPSAKGLYSFVPKRIDAIMQWVSAVDELQLLHEKA